MSQAIEVLPASTTPISEAQRKAIFAAGREHGFSIDDLRAMTPAGSISMLNRQQAAELLNRLNRGTAHDHPRKGSRGPRRPAGVYAMCSDAQRRKIVALGIELGWTTEQLQSWLARRHYADRRPMTKIDSSRDGAEVIELLKGVLDRSIAARSRAARPGHEAGSIET